MGRGNIRRLLKLLLLLLFLCVGAKATLRSSLSKRLKTKSQRTVRHRTQHRDGYSRTEKNVVNPPATLNDCALFLNDYVAASVALALQRQNSEILQSCLDIGTDINAPYENGRRVLHRAVLDDDIEMIKLVLSLGADVNAIDGNDETALHLAASSNFVEVANLLLGAEHIAVDPLNLAWETPLFYAAGEGHLKIVKLLLKHGADFQLRSLNQESVLQRAVEEKQPKIVQLLLESKAETDIYSKRGYTLLHIAAHNDDDDTIEFLLSAGLQIQADVQGVTPIHIAAQGGYLRALSAFIWPTLRNRSASLRASARQDQKFDVINMQDNKGNTALHYAIAGRHNDAVNLLLQCGADSEIENLRGLSPLAMYHI